jgi:hypothetical protein
MLIRHFKLVSLIINSGLPVLNNKLYSFLHLDFTGLPASIYYHIQKELELPNSGTKIRPGSR